MRRRRPARGRKPRPGWGTQSEYADHRGVTKQAVHKALARGRIQLANGLIDFAAADASWEANTDVARLRPRAAALEEPEAAAATEPAEPAGLSWAKVRAAREVYQMRLAKLDWEERSGALVRADEVRAAAFRAGRAVRDALASIPPRIAPLLHAAPDVSAVERILMEELRRISAGLGQEMRNGKPQPR